MAVPAGSPALALTLVACLVLGTLLMVYWCCACIWLARPRRRSRDESAPPFTAASVQERINDHQRAIDALEKLREAIQRDEAAIKERALSSK